MTMSSCIILADIQPTHRRIVHKKIDKLNTGGYNKIYIKINNTITLMLIIILIRELYSGNTNIPNTIYLSLSSNYMLSHLLPLLCNRSHLYYFWSSLPLMDSISCIFFCLDHSNSCFPISDAWPLNFVWPLWIA